LWEHKKQLNCSCAPLFGVGGVEISEIISFDEKDEARYTEDLFIRTLPCVNKRRAMLSLEESKLLKKKCDKKYGIQPLKKLRREGPYIGLLTNVNN
jgi:hypothetical protein